MFDLCFVIACRLLWSTWRYLHYLNLDQEHFPAEPVTAGFSWRLSEPAVSSYSPTLSLSSSLSLFFLNQSAVLFILECLQASSTEGTPLLVIWFQSVSHLYFHFLFAGHSVQSSSTQSRPNCNPAHHCMMCTCVSEFVTSHLLVGFNHFTWCAVWSCRWLQIKYTFFFFQRLLLLKKKYLANMLFGWRFRSFI